MDGWVPPPPEGRVQEFLVHLDGYHDWRPQTLRTSNLGVFGSGGNDVPVWQPFNWTIGMGVWLLR